jgi:hypothetical protein
VWYTRAAQLTSRHTILCTPLGHKRIWVIQAIPENCVCVCMLCIFTNLIQIAVALVWTCCASLRTASGTYRNASGTWSTIALSIVMGKVFSMRVIVRELDPPPKWIYDQTVQGFCARPLLWIADGARAYRSVSWFCGVPVSPVENEPKL